MCTVMLFQPWKRPKARGELYYGLYISYYAHIHTRLVSDMRLQLDCSSVSFKYGQLSMLLCNKVH